MMVKIKKAKCQCVGCQRIGRNLTIETNRPGVYPRQSEIVLCDKHLKLRLNNRYTSTEVVSRNNKGYIELNTVGHTVIYACGDGSMELSLKQEKECLVN